VLQAARNRFNEFLHMASVPADEADVERLRRERREAAAKDVKGTAGGSAAKEVRGLRLNARMQLACVDLMQMYVATTSKLLGSAVSGMYCGRLVLLLLLLVLQEELPESFFKLPRIRFLLILCKEILRINK
jgi:hypothetical protein